MSDSSVPYGKIGSVEALGRLIRMKRRSDGLTQAEAAGLCGVGTRLFSEVERGKASAEVGKVLRIVNGLGLDVTLTPRGGARS